jgi:intracellular sulfur oxidation DsrE/DsrF family protein
MKEQELKSRLERRSFLSRLGAGAAAFGTVCAAGVSPAQAQSRGGSSWQPRRHSEDDWFDELPGVHRFIFDNYHTQGFGQAMRFANNFINVNKNDYGVDSSDIAVVIVARSISTAFAFNDAIWEKYSVPLAARTGLNDPKTDQPPTVNLYNTSGYGGELPNGGLMLETLFEKGLRLAVCRTATRGYARRIAAAVDGDADNIYEELISNLVDNSTPVPAGIVAVNRAQERGYSFVAVA